jgi:hypothetical protein
MMGLKPRDGADGVTDSDFQAFAICVV